MGTSYNGICWNILEKKREMYRNIFDAVEFLSSLLSVNYIFFKLFILPYFVFFTVINLIQELKIKNKLNKTNIVKSLKENKLFWQQFRNITTQNINNFLDLY